MEYRIDTNGRIVEVSSDWDAFAVNNDGEQAMQSKVSGKPVIGFIKDDPTRMWFDTLVMHVRVKGGALEREYRCDSPTHRRYMRMKLVPEGSDIVVRHELVRVEPRQRPVVYFADEEGVECCSVCHRLRLDEWEEPDDVLSPDQEELGVCFSVCGGCLKSLP